jgi:hypothetical protein
MIRRTLQERMEDELIKFRDHKRFVFHGFAYNTEIDELRERLKMSGKAFRTTPVYRAKRIIGYNVYVEE